MLPIIHVPQIDREGRVIDYERAKGKVAIIEQEFKSAEKEELQRLREEIELRVSAFMVYSLFSAPSLASLAPLLPYSQRRVQKKRHEALEFARTKEKMAKIKEDRRIRNQLIQLTRTVETPPPSRGVSVHCLLPLYCLVPSLLVADFPYLSFRNHR